MNKPAQQKRHTAQRPARRERAIYSATLQELAQADYGGLSVERIALRAGVNKTTLYRRWPTKAVLVHAALNSIADAFELETSTGSLQGDLLALARKMLTIAKSLEAQSLMRLRLLDQPEPDSSQDRRQTAGPPPSAAHSLAGCRHRPR